MRAFKSILITLLVIYYSPNELTRAIVLYDYTASTKILLACAEGIGQAECLNPPEPRAVTYEDVNEVVQELIFGRDFK